MTRASILAIGTELTTGQVTNRNAASLSDWLSEIGVEVALHLTVPDDRELIQRALDHCAGESSVILVTGGLGPTTDDFTRDEVTRWLGLPLEFHAPSWERIRSRLGALGIPVAESNRQQCNFPKGAEILENPAGTASGFYVAGHGKHLIVLPGPPREIEAIWTYCDLAARFRGWFPGARKLELFTWQCLGKSEAELGELTEAAVAGSGLLTGYRAHRPFVEVKIWVPEGDVEKARPWFAKIEAAIGPWVATRQGEDLAARLVAKLAQTGVGVEVFDLASGGVLAERFASVLRLNHEVLPYGLDVVTEFSVGSKSGLSLEEQTREALSRVSDGKIGLALCGLLDESGRWAWGISRSGKILRVETGSSPFRKKELLDRAQRLAAELALKQWAEVLEANGVGVSNGISK